MTRGLKRFHQSREPHFITFSCYRRTPLLNSPHAKNTFITALERVRRTYGLRVFGYVVMPEHVHLLLSEPDKDSLVVAIKSLKQGVSRRLTQSKDDCILSAQLIRLCIVVPCAKEGSKCPIAWSHFSQPVCF